MYEKVDISLHTFNDVTNTTIFQLTQFQIRNRPYKTGERTSGAGSYLIGAQTLGDKEVQNIEKAQRVREGIRMRLYLESVLLLQLEILLPECVDTVNHDLDELYLGVSEPVFVGDVVGAAVEATGLSTGSTRLDSKLLTPLLEGRESLLGVAGEVNHDGGPHSCAQVGGAGVDEAVLFRQGEVLAALSLDRLSNSSDTTCETSEDTLDVTALLHRDDSHLILFIDPEEEGLGFIVEDTTSFRPVTLHTGNSKVAVSRYEEEVIVHKLLSDLLVHTSERVVGTSKVTSQLGEGALHQVLHSHTLLLGDTGRQSVSIDGTSHSDTGGVHGNTSVYVTHNLGYIHVGGVLGIR